MSATVDEQPLHPGPRGSAWRRGGLVAVLGVLTALASLALGWAVTDGGRTRRDEALALEVLVHVGRRGERAAELVAGVVNPLLSVLVLLAVAAVLALRRRAWGPLVVAGTAVAACTGAVLGQKHLFARPDQGGDLVHGGAYPSGHTATALVVGLTLVLLLLRHRPALAALASWVVLVGTAVLGAAMVLAGYHWATDIVGGVLTGFAVSCVTLGAAGVCRLPTHG